MSFDYISRIEAQTHPLPCYSDFDKHAISLSAQLSHINNSISRLSSLLEQVGGRRDSNELRASIQTLLGEIREKFKSTEEDVKKIQRWSMGTLSHSQQYTSENLPNTFSALFARFQSLQRVSAEITSRCLPSTSLVCGPSDALAIGPQLPSYESMAEQAEVEFQEAILLQREQEILSLREGVEDINDLLKTLAAVVGVQSDALVEIEGNVYEAARDIREADCEIRHASRLHKRARNRACCLLLVCAILFAIVMLAV